MTGLNGNGAAHTNGAHVPVKKILESKQKPPKKKAASKPAPHPQLPVQDERLAEAFGEYLAETDAKAVRDAVKPLLGEVKRLRTEVKDLRSRPTAWLSMSVTLQAYILKREALALSLAAELTQEFQPQVPDISLDDLELDIDLQPESEPLRLPSPVQQEPASTNKETRSWPLPKFLRRPQPQG